MGIWWSRVVVARSCGLLGELERIAKRRHDIHFGKESSRPFSTDYWLIALLGEYEFELDYNYPFDRSDKPHGDGRIDFHTPLATIDVKTARKPFFLLMEAGLVHAEILILAGVDEDLSRAHFLGWEWSRSLLSCPVKDFGYGVESHYKHSKALKPMWIFSHLLKWAERLDE